MCQNLHMPGLKPWSSRNVPPGSNMISADTNLFIYAADPDSSRHAQALGFFEGLIDDDSFVLCELVMIELYMQLRNPAIFKKPYTAREAAGYCRELKSNPAWRTIDYDPAVSRNLWEWAENKCPAYRQIIDARIGFVLRHHGVTRFATTNVKDFQGMGFKKVWNPLVIE